jgi:hypothetical protein
MLYLSKPARFERDGLRMIMEIKPGRFYVFSESPEGDSENKSYHFSRVLFRRDSGKNVKKRMLTK